MSFETLTLLLAVGILVLLAVTLGVLSAQLFLSATRTRDDSSR